MDNIEKTIKIMETFTEVYGVNIERDSHIYSACMQMAQWKDEQIKQLHEIIIKLWDMLDWIDTYADLRINGSEDDFYFSKIEGKTQERFAFVKSDGYDLFINDEKITNNERTRNISKTD